jgi:dTDP-D-glucose 4,6-dehydratase
MSKDEIRREKERQRNARRYAANREKVLESAARRYAANREKVQERIKRWYADNREKVREQAAALARVLCRSTVELFPREVKP